MDTKSDQTDMRNRPNRHEKRTKWANGHNNEQNGHKNGQTDKRA